MRVLVCLKYDTARANIGYRACRYGGSFPGQTLLRDVSFLSTLRECLVLIRIWNLLHQRNLLHFTTNTSNLDILVELFKLLTKVRPCGALS